MICKQIQCSHCRIGKYHSPCYTRLSHYIPLRRFQEDNLGLWFYDDLIIRRGQWRCNRKNVPPGKTYPPTVTVMPQHLKNISLSNLSFCRKILLNCLHILLKLQLWMLFYKKVLADFKFQVFLLMKDPEL